MSTLFNKIVNKDLLTLLVHFMGVILISVGVFSFEELYTNFVVIVLYVGFVIMFGLHVYVCKHLLPVSSERRFNRIRKHL